MKWISIEDKLPELLSPSYFGNGRTRKFSEGCLGEGYDNLISRSREVIIVSNDGCNEHVKTLYLELMEDGRRLWRRNRDSYIVTHWIPSPQVLCMKDVELMQSMGWISVEDELPRLSVKKTHCENKMADMCFHLKASDPCPIWLSERLLVFQDYRRTSMKSLGGIGERCPIGRVCVGWLILEEGKGREWSITEGRRDLQNYNEFTHWMLLPKLPEMDKKWDGIEICGPISCRTYWGGKTDTKADQNTVGCLQKAIRNTK